MPISPVKGLYMVSRRFISLVCVVGVVAGGTAPSSSGVQAVAKSHSGSTAPKVLDTLDNDGRLGLPCVSGREEVPDCFRSIIRSPGYIQAPAGLALLRHRGVYHPGLSAWPSDVPNGTLHSLHCLLTV
jgi:hypothetical protein